MWIDSLTYLTYCTKIHSMLIFFFKLGFKYVLTG